MNFLTRVGEGRFASDLAAGIRDVGMRFPVPLAAVLVLSLHANLMVQAGPSDMYRSFDISLGLISAVFLSLAATVASESRGSRWGTRQAIAVAAALLAFGLVWFDRLLGTLPYAVLAVSFGSVFLAPFLFRGEPLQFWSYGRRLVLELVIACLVLGAVTGGTLAVVQALEFLFDLDFPSETYGHIWAVSASLVAPLFALARFPRRYDEIPEDMLADTRLFSALRALADFVAAPVFLALALIFHLYAGKILAGGELPKGQIGWIVVAFGVGMVTLLLAFEPFRPIARAPLKFFLRFWPLMLPVPVILLALAAGQRVGDYGVTPERYLLAALGAVLAVLALLQLFPRTRRDIRLLAAVPLLALFISSFGPWGAVQISLADQTDRLRALVAEAKRSLKQEAEAQNLLSFLAGYGALDRIAPKAVDVGDLRDYRQRNDALVAVQKALGLTTRSVTNERRPDQFDMSFASTAFGSTGFDMVVPTVNLNRSGSDWIGFADGGTLIVTLKDLGVSVAFGRATQEFSFPSEAFQTALKTDRRMSVPIDLESGGKRAKLFLTMASGSHSPEMKLDGLTFSLLLRRADWPASETTPIPPPTLAVPTPATPGSPPAPSP